ncbi:MAG TPA: PhzF family phenazine biosynthesis protein [Thermoanaerobaculia bacterium]|nr:PhzF family phenazine biosynthesis protein [Thermoanaerobaculia bacterium]
MRLLQIDAFTDQPFRGNPAAVCLLDRERDDKWMQNVGAEMNLSETAFLLPQKEGWSLRWFTPSIEVALCGHATLASAHALWDEKLLAAGETARFHTKSGVLTAQQRDGLIELNFPATPEQQSQPPADLLQALGIESPRYVGKNKFDYLVEVGSEDEVRALKPDHGRLRQIPVRGVIVTSRASNGNYDFVSRFFAPGSGIDEDPVTGSAHCCLAPFWSQRLKKNAFTAYQASARGGVLRVQLDGDRVKLGGRAVTVLRGELAV